MNMQITINTSNSINLVGTDNNLFKKVTSH